MRINIEIDDALMEEAQRASGQATKKRTVDQALRLMVRLRRQQEVGGAFGKYRWRSNLSRSRKGRAGGDRCRWQAAADIDVLRGWFAGLP